jgi:hypothetical protein
MHNITIFSMVFLIWISFNILFCIVIRKWKKWCPFLIARPPYTRYTTNATYNLKPHTLALLKNHYTSHTFAKHIRMLPKHGYKQQKNPTLHNFASIARLHTSASCTLHKYSSTHIQWVKNQYQQHQNSSFFPGISPLLYNFKPKLIWLFQKYT